MSPHLIHHVEICCRDSSSTLKRLEKFGFKLFAEKVTPACKQLAVKLGKAIFIITQRKPDCIIDRNKDPMTILCCENCDQHEVDSVFNVAFSVRNVIKMTERIRQGGAVVIQEPITVKDSNGEITFSIIKSICGNIVHTILNSDHYDSKKFLVGFETTENEVYENNIESNLNITHIDHFTMACYPGDSMCIIKFYEAWGMTRFQISNEDNDGLILADGVGLRLRAMEYWRCAETGLTFSEGKNKERNPNAVMLVVVESLTGQTNCNVKTFLEQHLGPGIEHIALNAPKIVNTVEKLIDRGVKFRKPPLAYYDELQKTKEIKDLGEDLSSLKKLGILLDNESGMGSDGENESDKRYLMQIFANPLFDRKTFFIELIKRVNSARGLGSGNIIALVRCIREEERRKVAETKKNEEEAASNLRRLC